MKEQDIIENNNDFLVTETTIKKDTDPATLAEILHTRKATANVTTRVLQGGTASVTIIEKTKLSEKQRDAIRQILGMD